MKLTPLTSAVALIGMACIAFAAGCGNRSKGTPSTYTVNTSAAQIAAIQNDPNIPADRKAGIIAALKGDKTYRASAPTGAGAPDFSKATHIPSH